MTEHRRETNRMIATMNTNADLASKASSEALMLSARKIVIATAIALKDRLASLEKDADECWDWLSAHPDHPQYADLDEQVADMVVEVADIAGALQQAERRWFRKEQPVPETSTGVKLTPESIEAHRRVREWNANVKKKALEAKNKPAPKTKRTPRGNNDGNSGKHTYDG